MKSMCRLNYLVLLYIRVEFPPFPQVQDTYYDYCPSGNDDSTNTIKSSSNSNNL